MNEGYLASQFPDFRLQLHPLIIKNVANDHRRAFLHEQPGLGRALSSCSAADESNLSFQTHLGLPWYQFVIL